MRRLNNVLKRAVVSQDSVRLFSPPIVRPLRYLGFLPSRI